MSWLDKAWEKIKSAFGDKESGGSEQKCPLKETGLLVVVLKKESRQPIEGATVDVQGKTPGNKKTDKDGLVLFKPVKPASYKIDVTPPDSLKETHERPPLAYEMVNLGACPIRIIEVPPITFWVEFHFIEERGQIRRSIDKLGLKVKAPGSLSLEGKTDTMGRARLNVPTKDKVAVMEATSESEILEFVSAEVEP